MLKPQLDWSITVFLAGSLALVAFKLLTTPKSFVSRVPGPKSPSWLWGNMLQLVFPRVYGEFEYEWLKTFGSVYTFRGVLGETRLMVADPAALQHILNDRTFLRSPPQWQIGKLVFGEGSVYCAEGDNHRRLRGALSPGFSTSVIRNFVPIFTEIAQRIVHQWIQDSPSGGRVNVCDVIDRATLDIISEGASRLWVTLSTRSHIPNTLWRKATCTCCEIVFSIAGSSLFMEIFRAAGFDRSKYDLLAEVATPYIPTPLLRLFLYLPTTIFRALRSFCEITDHLSSTLMSEKADGSAEDMLGMLIKGMTGARQSKTTPAELAEQMRVILIAGQDTGSDTLAWCLHELSKDPEYQIKLREEVLSARNNTAKVDYDSLPLLNAFLKEVLRVYASGPYLERVASTDCVVPLSKSLVLTTGETVDKLVLRKGQYVALGVASYHRSEQLWGTDALDFKPSRWLSSTSPCTGPALGPYANLLTFSGGFRPCIGWRFAVLEMQVLLSEIVANFSVSPSLDPEDVVKPLYAGALVPITTKNKKGLVLNLQAIGP
ncbi:PAH-inducible cytochrome P450 monooxygenase [Mycena chlorophos]|uniref:PAH-inducible cytochrome P450 monooxygenase n=1 Tax=Mycena chlorophos TaxID=658473 RepID=A0A8H6SPD2_MYCCL|nr:PAH-inducible cytochrome P450 monooxygenase [Mycena chlorophos]